MKKRMMSVSENFKIGTSGYSYPGDPPKGWYGVFYPETRSKNLNELEYYSQFFDTVEINSTFYRPPSPAMSKAWAKKTPANFEFAVKVWQKFTHPKKIGDPSIDHSCFRRGHGSESAARRNCARAKLARLLHDSELATKDKTRVP